MSLRKLAHTPGLGCLFNYSARTAKSPTHPLWICSKTSPIVVRLLSQTWGASFDWRSGQGDYFWKFSCSLNTNINLKQAINRNTRINLKTGYYVLLVCPFLKFISAENALWSCWSWELSAKSTQGHVVSKTNCGSAETVWGHVNPFF